MLQLHSALGAGPDPVLAHHMLVWSMVLHTGPTLLHLVICCTKHAMTEKGTFTSHSVLAHGVHLLRLWIGYRQVTHCDTDLSACASD